MYENYVTFIKQLLQLAASKRTFNSTREQSMYEKGFLIGLLASLAYNDSSVYSSLRKKYNDLGRE